MSLKKIHEERKTENISKTSLEQLHQLNQLSKVELENSLLKEVLAEYQEAFRKLKEEQNQSLKNIEKTSKMLEKQIDSLEDLTQVVNRNMNEMMNRVLKALESEIMDLKDSNKNFLNSLREDLIVLMKDVGKRK